jgi:hypothetical protein
MEHGTLLLCLALLLVALLVLALMVWAGGVRRYVKDQGAQTASPYSLAALLMDFCTGLKVSHGRLPLSLRLFGLLLMLLGADLVLIVIVLLV